MIFRTDSGILKGAQEAVCGIQNTDLTNGTIQILGIHFSYNKKIQTERNYLTTVKKIQKALNVWITKSLTLEGKNLIFKTMGFPKLFIFDYNCPEFNIGKNSKNSENIFMILF